MQADDDLPAELTSGLQTRSYEMVDLEVRSDGDGRTIAGRAVPFGQVATLAGRYKERFLAGSFARQIASGQLGQVKMWASHQDRLSLGEHKHIGRTVRLEERGDGLHGEWHILHTAKGDEALELAREGELRGLSVGFVPVDGGTRKGRDGVLERHWAHLDHVAITATPVYAGAEVLAVRAETFRPLATYRDELAMLRAVNRAR